MHFPEKGRVGAEWGIPQHTALEEQMKGVFILMHPTAICWCPLSELNIRQGWLGCPSSSLSCPQGWPQGTVSSCLSPLPSLWRSDVYIPFPYRSGSSRLRGRASAKASWEEKTPQGVSALQLSWATWQQAFPCCHPPWCEEGKRKMRLSPRFIDLPALAWLREVASQFHSQRAGFIHFSFSTEAQGEKVWLGGSTREALPIRQVYQRNTA